MIQHNKKSKIERVLISRKNLANNCIRIKKCCFLRQLPKSLWFQNKNQRCSNWKPQQTQKIRKPAHYCQYVWKMVHLINVKLNSFQTRQCTYNANIAFELCLIIAVVLAVLCPVECLQDFVSSYKSYLNFYKHTMHNQSNVSIMSHIALSVPLLNWHVQATYMNNNLQKYLRKYFYENVNS